MADCTICYESFNKTIRKRIECPKCLEGFCVKCIKIYITTSEIDPICMKCGGEWDFVFLKRVLSKLFMENDYIKTREKILLDKEIAMLPDTLYLVDLYKNTEILRKREDTIQTQINKLKDEVDALGEEIENNDEILSGYKTVVDSVKINIECQCPSVGCRGFIKKESYNCAVCGIYICEICREVKICDIPHICISENIKTVNLLRQDTKPCPNCATPITKIDGCDQMWCTECKTAFSWNTGKVETGRVHNPHFYEWQRTHGTLAPEVNQCGGLRNFYTYSKTIISEENSMDIHRKIIELDTCIIPHINVKWDNKILRLNYLLGKITIQKLASKLQQREKIYKANNINVECLKLYCQVMTDMFNSGKIDTEQEKELRKYVNKTIKKAETLYGINSLERIYY